jgi:hypothetical protein
MVLRAVVVTRLLSMPVKQLLRHRVMTVASIPVLVMVAVAVVPTPLELAE